jgi:hypothetical protein
MSTIAEFISGTVNESLKKLLQPVGLIPAAIFVLLNLAFVYPAALADGNALAKAFGDLDGPTQAAVVALITLTLGYFLLSASSTILDILGGDLIRGSVLHALLVWFQRRRRDHLIRVDEPNTWHVSKRFNLSRKGETPPDPLPSALGNVLVATQGTVARRYGIDMATLLSPLVATPDIKELPARGVVEEERAARDTLGNTAFVLWLFALEGLVFFTFRDEPDNALLSLVAVPAGYAVYRFAVAKAHAWGSAVETLFDLHREKLHAALKLAKYGSLSAERRVWENADRFFVSDGEDGDEAFQKDDAPSVTAIPSGDLVIPAPVTAMVEGVWQQDGAVWLRWIEYVVLVAKKSTAPASTTAEVLVEDPRVARIDLPVAGLATQPAVARGAGGNDQALWTLANLAPGNALSLQYRLPLFSLHFDYDPTATPRPQPPLELVPGVGFSVTVPAAANGVRITCSGTERSRPEIRVGNEVRRPASSDGRSYRWSGLAGTSVWVVLPDEVRA